MNQTTKETRRRSYDAVLPKRAARCRLILETLGNRELTASEITEELVAAGRIPYFNRNYVAPRLTELKEIGILTTVGRRKATRSDATEAVWARAEPSGPTGQTAAAYADNPTEARQGVALNAVVEIKPRVMLRPFRTFLEVEQPESEFLLRVDPDEGIGFFEADGGIWKLEAKKNIADYFLKNMGDLIDAGKVVVMQ